MARESSNCLISAQPHHCDVDVQERFQTGKKSGWTGERMISPLFASFAARGPWLCSHLPHGTSCTGHTQTQRLSDRKSLYLYQVQRCLFASTPIKPFLAAPHHMLPLLNSWDAELLAAPVPSHFQSVPPQRKRSLTPASPRISQKCSQCCHFYRQSGVKQYTHGRLMCELGRLCVGAGFLLENVITESRQKDTFYNATRLRLDRT